MCFEPLLKFDLSFWQAVEVRTVVIRQGSHIFLAVGSQMAVMLSALRARLLRFSLRKILALSSDSG
jgi:hypothetical protein